MKLSETDQLTYDRIRKEVSLELANIYRDGILFGGETKASMFKKFNDIAHAIRFPYGV